VPAKVGYLIIDTADPDRVVPFWCSLLDVTVQTTFLDGGFVILTPAEGGVHIGFQRVPEVKSVKNRLHLDLDVPDLDAATAEIEGLGGRWLEPGNTRAFGDNMRWRLMADPEGNEFDLILGD
jgi:predicted enzyme related to lactoylglutathione lyase